MNIDLNKLTDKQIVTICNKFVNGTKLNDKQIVYLFDFIKSNDNKNDVTIVLMLIGNKHIDLSDLYDRYVNIKGFEKIRKDIDKSISFYNKLDLNDVFICSYIDKITNNINLILSNPDYLYSLRILDNLYNELDYFIGLYLDLKTDKTDKTDKINEFDITISLHKFIKQIDIFNIFDLYYNTNNLIVNNTSFKDVKDYYLNSNDLIGFKIDYDLMKSNEYLFKRFEYIKIVVYRYDNTDVYYICNKFDLIDINYIYSNYLSYLLDYKFDKYYNFFNNDKLINKGFKYIKTFNNRLNHLIKDLDKTDKNYKYSYNNNDFYTFNDLLNIVFELKFKYIDFKLYDYLKQIDLDLISIDNNNDYNLRLNDVYDYLNDILYYLDIDLKDSLNDNKDLLDLLIDLSKFNDLDINTDVLIKYMNCYNTNSFLLDALNLNEYTIKCIKNDISILNKVLDIIETMYKDLDKNNTLYEFKSNKTDLLNETLKHHNTKNKSNELDRIRNGTLNYCYDVNMNYFKIV